MGPGNEGLVEVWLLNGTNSASAAGKLINGPCLETVSG
jgi:hypothetical protein